MLLFSLLNAVILSNWEFNHKTTNSLECRKSLPLFISNLNLCLWNCSKKPRTSSLSALYLKFLERFCSKPLASLCECLAWELWALSSSPSSRRLTLAAWYRCWEGMAALPDLVNPHCPQQPCMTRPLINPALHFFCIDYYLLETWVC